jgi:AcrR family transcriptional regulator
MSRSRRGGSGTTINRGTILDTESTQTARTRLLSAGKALFARHGYELTSTAAIAREALTSESQLVRHFETKAGLLAAVFEEAWRPLGESIQTVVTDAPNAHEATLAVLSALASSLEADPELAFLLLFEGRRVRGGAGPPGEIALPKGFLELSELLQRLVRRGHKDGTFPRELSPAAASAALLGAAEGMLRERLAPQRAARPAPFGEAELSLVLAAVLDGLTSSRRADASASAAR